jgi:hypothetical protein
MTLKRIGKKMIKKISRQYGLWRARKRGKAAAIRDWNNRVHVAAMAQVDSATPESDALMRNHILEGISWLDRKDRGDV